MSKFSYFLIILALGQLHLVSSNVLELGDEFLNMESDGKWLVMFYAPWCGHCRNLEPTWFEVGASFSQTESEVKVVKIDATKYTSLASQYSIKGFPTIKFFRDGHQYDYNGARDKYSIVSFVNRASGPSITVFSSADSLAEAKNTYRVFFLYIGSENDDLYGMYSAITKDLFTTISFYSTSKANLPKDISVLRQPTLLVFKDNKYYELPPGLPDEEFLKLWILTEQFPSYNELTGMSYHLLRSSGKRFAIVALKPNDPFNSTFEKLAFERIHPYMFCWVLGNNIVNRMTSSEVTIPNVIVFDHQSFEYFVMFNESNSVLTRENVEEFFQKIKDGIIVPEGGDSLGWLRNIFLDFASFFSNLFTKNPIVGVTVVIIPCVALSVICIWLCSINDEEITYEVVDERNIDVPYENKEEVMKDNDENGIGDYDDEGLRKRIKDPSAENQ